MRAQQLQLFQPALLALMGQQEAGAEAGAGMEADQGEAAGRRRPLLLLLLLLLLLWLLGLRVLGHGQQVEQRVQCQAEGLKVPTSFVICLLIAACPLVFDAVPGKTKPLQPTFPSLPFAGISSPFTFPHFLSESTSQQRVCQICAVPIRPPLSGHHQLRNPPFPLLFPPCRSLWRRQCRKRLRTGSGD